jgi:beta-glucanase (GH16 family)
MISKLHGFLVIALFGVIVGSVVAGVVMSNDNTGKDPNYITNPPDFESPDGNITETETETENSINVPIWWDEFDGTELDRDYWKVMTGGDGWGNNEEQVYVDSPTNVEVSDSNLIITATRGADNVYTSGRVMTKGAWYPGMTLPNGKVPKKIRFESVITLPEAGQGIWPAFWAYPDVLKYGDFPGSGEIDIMELINAQEKLTQGLHFGGKADRRMSMNRTPAPDGSFSFGTFKFAVDWFEDRITFLLNDEPTVTYYSKSVDESGWFTDFAGAGKNAPFDTGFSMILNVAVGGNWAKSPDSTTPDVVSMFVEYVRVYADF